MKAYRLTCDFFCDNDSGDYVSYGIEIIESGRTVKYYKDLSLNKSDVEDLCEQLNRLQVKYDEEIIEDFLEK